MNITDSLFATESRQFPLRTLAIHGAEILDACAVHASYGHLIVLKADGEISGVNLDNGNVTSLCSVELPPLPADEDNSYFGRPKYRLHASASGEFCAIVVDRGQQGIVFETSSGLITMYLNGGDYYENTVPFSACFICMEDRDVFVFRSEWNRLDAADPRTGSLLSERVIATYESAGPRPEHYLDYFHGRLWPSADGSRILDDGWIWHPVSMPRIWSVSDWLQFNPWESEDGESVVELPIRDDWNTPTCWLDEHHVAMWGLSEWDSEEFESKGNVPGVQIVNVTSSERSTGERWAMDVHEDICELLSDGKRLFVVGGKDTAAWDISSRSQLFTLPGFAAHLYIQKRDTLIAFGGNTVLELSVKS